MHFSWKTRRIYLQISRTIIIFFGVNDHKLLNVQPPITFQSFEPLFVAFTDTNEDFFQRPSIYPQMI